MYTTSSDEETQNGQKENEADIPGGTEMVYSQNTKTTLLGSKKFKWIIKKQIQL